MLKSGNGHVRNWSPWKWRIKEWFSFDRRPPRKRSEKYQKTTLRLTRNAPTKTAVNTWTTRKSRRGRPCRMSEMISTYVINAWAVGFWIDSRSQVSLIVIIGRQTWIVEISTFCACSTSILLTLGDSVCRSRLDRRAIPSFVCCDMANPSFKASTVKNTANITRVLRRNRDNLVIFPPCPFHCT